MGSGSRKMFKVDKVILVGRRERRMRWKVRMGTVI